MYRTVAACTIAAVTAIFAGCGGSDPPPAVTPGSSAPARQAATGNATAEQVAREARADLDCPPRVQTPAPAAGTPVADVLGVRPGQTYDEARALVLCSHDLLVASDQPGRGFQLQTYGQTLRQGFAARFAEARVEKSSKEIMREMQDDMMARSTNSVRRDMQPGQAKWYVSTMGLPGEERVINVAREEWFAAGRNPTMASVVDALVKKYGPPSKDSTSGPSRMLAWLYDPQGRPIPDGANLQHQCIGTPDPDGAVSLSPDCGVVVDARIHALRDNPDLSESLQVGVLDQARGYALVEGTERALQAQDAARRAQEVSQATKNADAPKL